METPNSPRAELLDEVKGLVCRDRNNSYGPPTQDFDRTAAMINIMFAGKLLPGEAFTSADVAKIQMLVKLSRLTWMPDHKDSWHDIAGYAACGWECALDNASKVEVVVDPNKCNSCGNECNTKVCRCPGWCVSGLDKPAEA